jgi:hypothetical protein
MAIIKADFAEDLVVHKVCHGSGLVGHKPDCHNRDRLPVDWTEQPLVLVAGLVTEPVVGSDVDEHAA